MKYTTWFDSYLTSEAQTLLCQILSDSLLPWQKPFSAMTIHPLIPWQFTPYWCDILLFNILTFYLLLTWHFTPFFNDRPLFLQIALISMTIFHHLQWLVIICTHKAEKRHPSVMYPSMIHSLKCFGDALEMFWKCIYEA